MDYRSKHISTYVNRSPDDVYQFVRDPRNLPLWAAGLSDSIAYVNGQWLAGSPMGKVIVAFAPENPFGVLDHAVTLPNGVTVNNPMRVFAHRQGSEVVFSLLQPEGMAKDEFERDAQMVQKDLHSLKALLEQ